MDFANAKSNGMNGLNDSPHLIAFERLTVSGLDMTIEARATREIVHCPKCQQPTQKVHSRYIRRPRDLPTAGLRVRVLLKSRKFFCENATVHYEGAWVNLSQFQFDRNERRRSLGHIEYCQDSSRKLRVTITCARDKKGG